MRKQAAIVVLVAWVYGCGNVAITEPLVVKTGTAMPTDGYEAALSTAEAGGYPILVKDPKHFLLRIRARSSSEGNAHSPAYFEIKAWSGFVDVNVLALPGVTLSELQVDQLSRERRELAWSISTRARFIAGEAIRFPQQGDWQYTAPKYTPGPNQLH